MSVCPVEYSPPPLLDPVCAARSDEGPPTYPCSLCAPEKFSWPPTPSAYFSPAGPLMSSGTAWRLAASRSEAFAAGGRVVAPEVSVLLSVDEAPLTPRGVALSFSAKAPPDCTDSAARESEAMGPVGSCLRLGSFCETWGARGFAAVEPSLG